MYYRKQIDSLQKIFGTTDLELTSQGLRVGRVSYPIHKDVIDLTAVAPASKEARDIQYTFGAEWTAHGQILPEHRKEFTQYFDLVDVNTLKGQRVCDLGCGAGRWSTFLKDTCRELVLVDFSDAIYVARENLRDAEHCLFFKADITQLPFVDNFADFILCLGVLHHLPVPCMDAVRQLKRFAPKQLIFLYYALDNRPFYFRWILHGVTLIREILSRVKSPLFRSVLTSLGTYFLYLPLIGIGRIFALIGLGRYVPLYEFYRGKSIPRLRQDVYDRFFTRIEQRVTRAQILELRKDFKDVRVSDHLPYWHFLLTR